MDRYYQMTPVIPGFTPSTAPVEFSLVTENALLVDIEIVIPTGHVGITGVRVLQSHQQILPWGNLSWVQGDGYSRVFEVNAEIGSKSLSVQGYNDDFFQHVFHLRFHLRDLTDARAVAPSASQQAAQGLLSLSPVSTP